MAAETRPDEPEVPPLRLEERVLEALREHPGALAFNGLRRTLRAHPESLTRALRRLERWGQIARDDTGYRLAEVPPGEDPDPLENAPNLERAAEPPRRAVAEVELGPGLDARQLLGLLAGRWTSSLRWVGVYDRAREPLLVWSRSDGPGQLLMGIRNGRLRVYAEVPEGGRVPRGVSEAAQDLLIFALERLRHLGGAPRVDGAPAFVVAPTRPSFGDN